MILVGDLFFIPPSLLKCGCRANFDRQEKSVRRTSKDERVLRSGAGITSLDIISCC